jgi:hypothetical protein
MWCHLQELVVTMQLPGVKSAAAVELDMDRQQLHVHVPGRYLLVLGPAQLHYSLLPDKGSAKFDKHKQQLTVTLAVDQPPQQQQQPAVTSAVAELVEQPKLQQESGGEEQRPEDQQRQQQVVAAEQTLEKAQVESRSAVDAVAVLTRRTSSDEAAGKTFSQAQWDAVHQTLDKQVQQQQHEQQQRQHLVGASKPGAKVAPPQPQPAYVKPRLLSRHLNALTDLD